MKKTRRIKPWALQLKLPGSEFVAHLNAAAANELLRRFDDFGADCSDAMKRFRERLREELRKAGKLGAEGRLSVSMKAKFRLFSAP